MLRAASQGLFYYSRGDRENPDERMEIDFILVKLKVGRTGNVIPVEVKSSSRYSTVSLEKFCRKFRARVARPVVLHPANVRETNGILRLPLYMAPLLPELD